MFFRSRSTSAAKSTPGSWNWLISLVRSKTGVSPAAPFSVGLLSLDTVAFSVGLLSLDTVLFSVGLMSLDTALFSAGLLSLETVPFFNGLLSLDTVAFFVGLLSLDMMFPLGLVECPRELVAASHLPDIRLHRRGLAHLDRPSRTASLRTSRSRQLCRSARLLDVFAGKVWGSSIRRRRTICRERK